jgi:hypothetical protein
MEAIAGPRQQAQYSLNGRPIIGHRRHFGQCEVANESDSLPCACVDEWSTAVTF